jgi:hypothetical protein
VAGDPSRGVRSAQPRGARHPHGDPGFHADGLQVGGDLLGPARAHVVAEAEGDAARPVARPVRRQRAGARALLPREESPPVRRQDHGRVRKRRLPALGCRGCRWPSIPTARHRDGHVLAVPAVPRIAMPVRAGIRLHGPAPACLDALPKGLPVWDGCGREGGHGEIPAIKDPFPNYPFDPAIPWLSLGNQQLNPRSGRL